MFDVIHLLTGDSAAPPLLDSMVDLYISKRKLDLETVMWHSHYFSPPAAQRLIAAYEALPEESRFSYLLSPATYELVHAFEEKPVENCEQLTLYAYDQLSVAQGRPAREHRPDAQEIWSPTGGEVLRRTDGDWTIEHAEKFDSLVVIDFDSPFARAIGDSPLMARPAEDFSPDERENIKCKMHEAYRYIDRVVPTFGRLIRNYTRAARIRKCAAFTDVSSEHVTNTIGEIRLMNVHQDAYSMLKVAESLVHESVHNLLSTYEYVYGHFLVRQDDRNYRPVSLWSGNPIPVGSFCHAIFVWFALYSLAVHELKQPGITKEQRREIQKRRNHYASGFMVPTPLSGYLQDLGLFNRDYLPTIDRIQHVVRSLVRDEVRHDQELTAIAV